MKIGHKTELYRDVGIKKALPKGESRIRGFSMNCWYMLWTIHFLFFRR